MELLTVAGNEGNGISLIHEADDVFDIFLFLTQFPGQDLCNAFHSVLLFGVSPGIISHDFCPGKGFDFILTI